MSSGNCGGPRRWGGGKTISDWADRRRERWAEAFALVESGDASDKVVACVNLAAQGMGIREIAEATGWANSTVGQALHDPTDVLTRERKMKGARKCLDCDRLCNTDGRASQYTLRCSDCERRRRAAIAKWKPEGIIEAMHRWADLYGEAPSARDWNIGLCTPEAAAAFRAGDYPHLTEVQRRFGSWNNALEAAGYERRKPGSFRRQRRPFPVPAALKPEDILQREIEKLQGRRTDHETKIAELDKEIQRYGAAQEVLAKAG